MNYNNTRKGFLQKLGFSHHEYWSWWWFSIPTWPLWIWYAIRLRNATWFTAVNPGIEHSGYTEESKTDILKNIPSNYLPKTIFIEFLKPLPIENIFFPCIAKPDIGGRGRKIETIHTLKELQNYHAEIGENYMLQEIIESNIEFGIFYVKIPSEPKGKIISVTGKGFLSVVGNGKNTILELMNENPRAIPQIERLSKTIDINEVLKNNEVRIIEPIGNHCRGTAFINRNDLINERLEQVFDKIVENFKGFNYGRFDLRVNSMEDLYAGKNIFIVELNGLTSMDTHIFDPNFKLRNVLPVVFKNVTICYKIAKENIANGTKTTPISIILKKSLAFFNE